MGERSVEYTDEGKLVGHLVMAAQWIHDKARRVGVPRDLEHHVVHLVLAHHGRVEFGSPKAPLTLEALLTHYIDELDSRVNSWLNLMGREGGTRRWTSADNVYEQPIWRGALPTAQVEKKGPPAELLTPVIYVPRQERGGGQGQPKKQKEKRRPEPRPQAGEAKAGGEGGAPAEARAEGAAPEPRPERPERAARPERHDRPDRGPRGPGGPGGFGDKKRGYQGPRLPGDKGPHARPPQQKALTHNPFAALAAKLEDAGGKEEAAPPPEEAAPAAAPPPASEPPPPTAETAPEPAAREAAPAEGAPGEAPADRTEEKPA
jgi:3'-5' exoribonuclease